MRFKTTITALALLCAPGFAYAQTTEATGVGQAVSSSQSGSQALSVSRSGGGRAAATGGGGGTATGGNVTFNTPGNTTSQNSSRISGTQRVIAAPSVFAPGLAAAGIETCLGSVSGGVSFPGGGVAFGTTTKDTGCDTRLDSRTLWSFGLKAEAIARLCMKEETRQALGARCPQPMAQTAAFAGTASASPSAPSARSGIELREGRTGRIRWCDVYDAAAQRCRKWGA
jgi:hypothetical protein